MARILILDDDKTLLEALKRMLSEHNYIVDCSDNAQTAVEMVKKNHYDFVLVDYRMPGKDGIWFMQNTKLPKKTKALLMTAYANRQVINQMFKLGASGYLIKPFDAEEILRHLKFHAGTEFH